MEIGRASPPARRPRAATGRLAWRLGGSVFAVALLGWTSMQGSSPWRTTRRRSSRDRRPRCPGARGRQRRAGTVRVVAATAPTWSSPRA